MLEKFAKCRGKCSCPSYLKVRGAFYRLGGDRITMSYLLLHPGRDYMASGTQGREGRFVEVGQGFHGVPASS
jgi:hypothetical protein